MRKRVIGVALLAAGTLAGCGLGSKPVPQRSAPPHTWDADKASCPDLTDAAAAARGVTGPPTLLDPGKVVGGNRTIKCRWEGGTKGVEIRATVDLAERGSVTQEVSWKYAKMEVGNSRPVEGLGQGAVIGDAFAELPGSEVALYDDNLVVEAMALRTKPDIAVSDKEQEAIALAVAKEVYAAQVKA